MVNKAATYTFVGYSQESKAYRLLNRESGKITISRDVIFVENELIKHNETSEINMTEENLSIEEPTVAKTPDCEEKLIKSQVTIDNTTINIDYSVTSRGSESTLLLDDVPLGIRLERLAEQLDWSLLDRTIGMDIDKTRKAKENLSDEPRSPEEALSGPNSKHWGQAMLEEIKSRQDNHTWTLEPLPKGKTFVFSR